MKKLTHITETGKANMVDVGGKPVQLRIARATGHIRLNPETLSLIRKNTIKKGDVLTIAEIAGIQGAKKTSELIPLCHPLQITRIDVKAVTGKTGITVASEVRCVGQTGVEMEALTAVSIALLTIYDMCKAVDKTMTLEKIKLVSKTKEDC
jgi:cyclic pyranopterin monophosphate synthase